MSLWNESVWYSLLAGMALKSTAVLAAAWLISICLRGRSASARHLVWTAAFAALVALPFLSIALPSVSVPVGRTLLSPVAMFTTDATAGASDSRVLGASPRVSARVGSQTAAWRPDWRLAILSLWAAGATAVLLQMLFAWIAVWRMRRNARRPDVGEFAALAHSLGIHQQVDLLEGPPGSMPMTFGLFRPAVFLPSGSAEWTAERRRMVLLHELAHVSRGDIATQLLARIALTLHWWNPLAWNAWREFLKERERAADDLVLMAGASASAYADQLLAIARSMQSPSLIGSAAVAMARRSQLESRLLAILDSRVNRKSPGRAFAATATLLAVGIVAPLAALHGQDAASTAIPADVDATIRAATSQKNYAMLDSAAAAAESAHKYEIARRLLDASLAIRLGSASAQSQEYGLGLLQLGDLESKRGKAGSPQTFYEQAASALGDSPAAAPALIHLGVHALAKSPDKALEYFEHAKLVNPGNAGPATMWMAVVRQRQSNATEAEALYRAALDVQDATSQDAATTMELYANFMQQQGREDEARSMQARAAALRKMLSADAANSTVFRTGKVVTAGTRTASIPASASLAKPPKLLSKVEPEYTEEARAAKYQGTAIVQVEVGTDGLAHNIRIMRGLGLGLNDMAIDAVSQWRFQPGVKDGQPVPVTATIEINWRLL